MDTLRYLLSGFFFSLLLLSCDAQQRNQESLGKNRSGTDGIVGGPFENGEFMYIGMPDNINSVDTSPGWSQKGQKLLVTGTIFKLDGKTPAPNVVLYYYHTDIKGLYSRNEGLDSRVVRHGYIRGWVKSDANGHYAIYTVRPAPYPNRGFEAHIHPSIKEPGIDKEYYIDEFVFDDDKLLTSDKRRKLENRGGSGILRVINEGDMQVAVHNIVLGLNIPNYPEKQKEGLLSGLPIGFDQPSFTPYHAYGPDKGSIACPVCKYGRYQGIIYFVGRHPDWESITKWLVFLEQESVERGKYLKAYFVFGDDTSYDKIKRQRELEAIGNQLSLKNIAITFVPSFSDIESEISLSKINPEVRNTFIIYRNGTIVDKYINLLATQENFNLIAKVLGAYVPR
jgi:protocatechuate 3,4-dioxygenase, beta subunit